MFAPTVVGGALISPSLLTAVMSIIAPTIIGDVTALAPLLQGVATFPSPTVVGTGPDVVATPAIVAAVISLFAPTITGGGTALLSLLTATTIVRTPHAGDLHLLQAICDWMLTNLNPEYGTTTIADGMDAFWEAHGGERLTWDAFYAFFRDACDDMNVLGDLENIGDILYAYWSNVTL